MLSTAGENDEILISNIDIQIGSNSNIKKLRLTAKNLDHLQPRQKY